MDNQLTGVTVLVVDDGAGARRDAERILGASGCRVLGAVNGFDALSQVVDQHPDIIFVDTVMPRLDGYQTCSLIKSNEAYAEIPVVLLAGSPDRFDRARGRVAGADGHLDKPLDPNALRAAVAHHLGLREPRGDERAIGV